MLQRLLRYPSTLTIKSEDSATTAAGDSVYSETPSPRQSPESLPFDIASYLEEGLAKESRWDLIAPLPKGDYRHLRVVRSSDDDWSFTLETEGTNDFLAYCHVDILSGCESVEGSARAKVIRAKLYYYRPDDVLFKLDKPALVMVSSADRSEWTVLSTRCDGCSYRRRSSGTCIDLLSAANVLPRSSTPLLENPIKYQSNAYAKVRRPVGALDISSQQLAGMVQGKRPMGHGMYNFMEMAIPYGKDTIWCPSVRDQSWTPLNPGLTDTSCVVLATKEPQWNHSMSCLVLDFDNRIIIPSAKNFQLVLKDSPDTIVCQYGKVDNNVYALDVSAPLSIMQAFAAAISTALWA
ncbi:hypothetical protein FOZ61_004402 [Perkinsus olseni]|uniref:Tubby C-terminal domain-containing protein n=1 Tax=Perkinsus olseni TaxID=32597 RepID=A0A7J6LZ17_PEROL|nr:hypothetical protein FOZ61_004402 [Perkinsus olseni]KAF4664406.1 hypothetical protein FOL46_004265 [Perkinsus olseni]